MNKKITIRVLVTFCLVLFLSCSNNTNKTTDQKGEEKQYYIKADRSKIIIEIDSCEYVMSSNKIAQVHRGNCKFCKERREKELKRLITELKNLMSELRETDLLFFEEEEK